MVVAPTYKVLEDATIRSFKAAALMLGVLLPSDIRRSPPSMKLTTGAEIIFRSADNPDNLRGPNLSGCWLDEASLMHRDVYDIMLGRLREGGQQGWMTTTFTPKGLSHWTFEIFGKQPGLPNTELFFARTEDNPFNPAGFVENLRHNYTPARALQELDGQFCNVEGAEFPHEWFRDDLWVPAFPEHLTLRVMYLDPSLGKDAAKKATKLGDYSAYVQLGRDPTGILYVSADLARRPTTQIVSDGIRLARGFTPLDAFGVETNAFQRLLADDLLRQSREQGIALPIYHVTNTTNKQDRIRRLTPYLSRGIVRFVEGPGTRLLVQQLREFPMGQFDDGPDGFEGVLRIATEVVNGKKRRSA